MKKLYMIALLAILFANSLMAQKGPEKLYYTVPTVPESIKFGGETIDLKRADRYERMDREMIAFSYAHSVTLLMIKRSTRIFPQVEPILKECGVPDDLKYLMVNEIKHRKYTRFFRFIRGYEEISLNLLLRDF